MLSGQYPLSVDQIDCYRNQGFVQLDNVITGEALTALRTAVAGAVAAETNIQPTPQPRAGYGALFIQKVNLWQRHPTLKQFVTSTYLGNIAAGLSGMPMRLWHDQALFKEPEIGVRTPWHQDAHYWPHVQKRHQISIWIALKDATARNGCLSFIPGTHTLEELAPIDLANPQDIFELAPQARGRKPVMCELKAGSCTCHNGLTFHFAGPNKTNLVREAFAILYMPDGTLFNGKSHVCTAGKSYKVGEALGGAEFPLVSDLVFKAKLTQV